MNHSFFKVLSRMSNNVNMNNVSSRARPDQVRTNAAHMWQRFGKKIRFN